MSTVTEQPPPTNAAPATERPRRKRGAVRFVVWIVAAVVLVGALTAWGVRAHRNSPEFYPAHQVDKVDAVAFLKRGFADLTSAALVIQVGTGDNTVNLEGAVDWSQPESRAAFRVSAAGVPTEVVLRVIGDDAWARIGTRSRWGHQDLTIPPSGRVETAVSQIARGTNLRHLFASKLLKPSELRFKGWTIVNGQYGGVFNLTVSAAALRAAVPGFLADDDHRTRIPAQIMIDEQNRFSGFQIKANGTSVGATIIRRNPEVKVAQPAGRTVPMSSLVPAAEVSAR